MTIHRIEANANALSTMFDDYIPEARAKYEGTHMRVECHIPVEFAKALPLSTPIVIEFDDGKETA